MSQIFWREGEDRILFWYPKTGIIYQPASFWFLKLKILSEFLYIFIITPLARHEEIEKKVHNGSENSKNKKKYGVEEKSVKKYHNLGPNGIIHNSG